MPGPLEESGASSKVAFSPKSRGWDTQEPQSDRSRRRAEELDMLRLLGLQVPLDLTIWRA